MFKSFVLVYLSIVQPIKTNLYLIELGTAKNPIILMAIDWIKSIKLPKNTVAAITIDQDVIEAEKSDTRVTIVAHPNTPKSFVIGNDENTYSGRI